MRQVLENVPCFRDDDNGGEVYRDTLTFTGFVKGVWSDTEQYDGQPVDLVRVMQPGEGDFDDVFLPVFIVRLPNGKELQAFGEEVTEEITVSRG